LYLRDVQSYLLFLLSTRSDYKRRRLIENTDNLSFYKQHCPAQFQVNLLEISARICMTLASNNINFQSPPIPISICLILIPKFLTKRVDNIDALKFIMCSPLG
jgi:hypothetical protein